MMGLKIGSWGEDCVMSVRRWMIGRFGGEDPLMLIYVYCGQW